MDQKEAINLAVPMVIGAATPVVIKKYVITGANDTTVIPGLPMGLGSLSSVVSNGAAIAAIVAAVAGMHRKGPAMLRRAEIQKTLLAFGIPALTVGLIMSATNMTPSSFMVGSATFHAVGPSVSVRNAGGSATFNAVGPSVSVRNAGRAVSGGVHSGVGRNAAGYAATNTARKGVF